MTFTVFMYAMGGYAVVVLTAMLVVEKLHDPVAQSATPHGHAHAELRPWPRATRRCPVAHEHALPLRSAQISAPPRRRRPSPTSCRR